LPRGLSNASHEDVFGTVECDTDQGHGGNKLTSRRHPSVR
jgi:hypothetical protein